MHMFNEQDLTEYSLLSVSKLCKAGLRVVFPESSVHAYDSNHITRLHGDKDPYTNATILPYGPRSNCLPGLQSNTND